MGNAVMRGGKETGWAIGKTKQDFDGLKKYRKKRNRRAAPAVHGS
jgi:hypothetical protein